MPLTEKQKKSIIRKMNTLNEENLKKTLKRIDEANTEQLINKINKMEFKFGKPKDKIIRLVEKEEGSEPESEAEFSD